MDGISGSKSQNLHREDSFPLSTSPSPSDFSALEHDEITRASARASVRGKTKSKLNPHTKYFFEDGNLLIRVGIVDFKVHRYFFMRDSLPFRRLSNDGAIGRIVDRGTDDDSDPTESVVPLVLQGITSVDFECFLGVLYPNYFDRRDDTSSYWASVLKVSDYLSFASIRSLSIEQLSYAATSVERITLGRQYDITHWLKWAYLDVCTRKDPLSREEGRRLGVDEVIRIMEARQILLWEQPKMQRGKQNEVLERIFGLGTEPKPESKEDGDEENDTNPKPVHQSSRDHSGGAGPSSKPTMPFQRSSSLGSLPSGEQQRTGIQIHSPVPLRSWLVTGDGFRKGAELGSSKATASNSYTSPWVNKPSPQNKDLDSKPQSDHEQNLSLLEASGLLTR